jgi:hypothetical protein
MNHALMWRSNLLCNRTDLNEFLTPGLLRKKSPFVNDVEGFVWFSGSSHVITTLLASCDVFCFPLVYLITIPCFLRPLIWLIKATQDNKGSQMNERWLMALSTYDINWRHLPGSRNVEADALSRAPFITPTVDAR